jgi:hypothetical protein
MHPFFTDGDTASPSDPEAAPAHFNGPPTMPCQPDLTDDGTDLRNHVWVSIAPPSADVEELGIMDARPTIRPSSDGDSARWIAFPSQ